MTSQVYIVLLTVCATVISITAAFFSVTGLMSLFAGTHISVAVMAGSLELSKFIVVGFVYRYWGHIHRPLKAYLIFSIVVLMVITSTGIYGYLSNSYQLASGPLHLQLMQIETLEDEYKRVNTEIEEMKGFITQIPVNRISKKFEFQREYEPRMRSLRTRGEKILTEINVKKQELLSLNSKVGPIVYLAKALGADVDTVVKWLILVFVSVFDPLAVSLIFSLNLLIRLREKYRGDELKIGAQSLTTPVDHRFSKKRKPRKLVSKVIRLRKVA